MIDIKKLLNCQFELELSLVDISRSINLNIKMMIYLN